MNSCHRLLPLALPFLLLLAGCASARMRDRDASAAPAPGTRASVVFLSDFDPSRALFALAQPPPGGPAAHAQRFSRQLSDQMEQMIRAEGVPVRRLAPGQTPPPVGWLVWGRLRLLSDRPARTETETYFYELTTQTGPRLRPFLRFRTVSKSASPQPTARTIANALLDQRSFLPPDLPPPGPLDENTPPRPAADSAFPPPALPAGAYPMDSAALPDPQNMTLFGTDPSPSAADLDPVIAPLTDSDLQKLPSTPASAPETPGPANPSATESLLGPPKMDFAPPSAAPAPTPAPVP